MKRDVYRKGTLKYHDDTGSYLVTSKGVKCRVDPDIIDMLSEYTWCQNNKNYIITNYYINNKYKNVFLHHMVAGYPLAGLVCDHINNNNLDNRRCNLQFITNRENCTKDTKNKGILYREDRKSWLVIMALPKTSFRIALGYFNTSQEAKEQRERALAIIDTCTKEDLINLRKQYGRNAK
jgi:hypothetical protein